MKIHEASLVYRVVQDGPSAGPLDSPQKAYDYLAGAFDTDPTVEWFVVILLNRKHHPLGRVPVTRGTASSALVHPREVFKPAIAASASAVIVAHNHPSGDPTPSRADIQITRQLKQASEVIGIDLLDHLVIGEPGDVCARGFYSFQESGLL